MLYNCIQCSQSFETEAQYKTHYWSEFHRYNVKRRLIGLPPITVATYQEEFQTQASRSESTHTELQCASCSKRFACSQTYQQHLSSAAHRRRMNRRVTLTLSRGSSNSSNASNAAFLQPPKVCPFCDDHCSKDHLAQAHNFPPHSDDCVDLDGLIDYVLQQVAKGECTHCAKVFKSNQAAKDHMAAVGHTGLDLDNFTEYEQFYLWKIEEENETQDVHVQLDDSVSSDQKAPIILKDTTLADVKRARLSRLKPGLTGASINGRVVGFRQYRKYYKQYLGSSFKKQARQMPRLGCAEDAWLLDQQINCNFTSGCKRAQMRGRMIEQLKNNMKTDDES